MPQAVAQDLFQNFRFRVMMLDDSTFKGKEMFDAGFNAVTVPEITVGSVEYREGHRIYTWKQSGIPGFADVTLSRGISRGGDSSFYKWIKATIEGRPYRANLVIHHFHRDDFLGGDETGGKDAVNISPPGEEKDASRQYKLINAFPIRVKLSSDLDATAEEVSIQEMDLAVEQIQLVAPEYTP